MALQVMHDPAAAQVLAANSKHVLLVAARLIMARLTNPDFNCESCGSPFYGWDRTQRFCSKACSRASARAISKKTPEQLKASRARKFFNYQIISGKIDRPNNCSACGMENKINSRGSHSVQAHHHRGYDYPLDVIWLCQRCHTKADGNYGETAVKAKLTGNEALEIRRLYAAGEFITSIAPKFNIGTSAVWEIISRQTWKHL
jgi:hypothetical protein